MSRKFKIYTENRLKKKKFYCKVCKKNTKKHQEERCSICLDFRGRGDYERFLTGRSRTGDSYPH
jgi:hypothetical protein